MIKLHISEGQDCACAGITSVLVQNLELYWTRNCSATVRSMETNIGPHQRPTVLPPSPWCETSEGNRSCPAPAARRRGPAHYLNGHCGTFANLPPCDWWCVHQITAGQKYPRRRSPFLRLASRSSLLPLLPIHLYRKFYVVHCESTKIKNLSLWSH